MTEKIKVSREVGEAIEFYGKLGGNGWYNAVLADVARLQSGYRSSEPAITLSNKYTLYELAEILVKGYEVETPEELLLKEYKSMNGACTPKTEFGRSAIERRKGFLTALNILGVKVEGVNS